MPSNSADVINVLPATAFWSIEVFVHAGLYLLGFKARSCLRSWHTWRQSTFVYPDEHSMPGSTTAFIALHEAMLQSDRCLHLLACALVLMQSETHNCA